MRWIASRPSEASIARSAPIGSAASNTPVTRSRRVASLGDDDIAAVIAGENVDDLAERPIDEDELAAPPGGASSTATARRARRRAFGPNSLRRPSSTVLLPPLATATLCSATLTLRAAVAERYVESGAERRHRAAGGGDDERPVGVGRPLEEGFSLEQRDRAPSGGVMQARADLAAELTREPSRRRITRVSPTPVRKSAIQARRRAVEAATIASEAASALAAMPAPAFRRRRGARRSARTSPQSAKISS